MAAAEALGQIGPAASSAVPALQQQLVQGISTDRRAAIKALTNIKKVEPVPAAPDAPPHPR
jgi:HEAT repeat protein